MKTYHTFKNVENFQKFLRTKYRACHESGCIDYVTVAGKVFTMHEYDSNGQLVTWANKKHNLMIEMETADRYKNGYGDAEVSQFNPYYMREDISYAQ